MLSLVAMPGVSWARCTLAAALIAGSAACSLAVSLDGLSNGGGRNEDAGGAGSKDAGGAGSSTADVAMSESEDVSLDAGSPPSSADGMAAPDVLLSDDSAVAPDVREEPPPDAATCVAVTSGLLGHWTMDQASISGNVVADVSGNHNDGTLVGFTAPETAPGQFGDALVYPASGTANMKVPSLALATAAAGTNTVSLWYYRSAFAVNDVLALLPNAPRYDLWLTTQPDGGGTGSFLCLNTGHGECFGLEDATLLNRWVHVVAMFVNGVTSQGTIYVDGQRRTLGCLVDAGFPGCGQSAVAADPVLFGGESDFPFHGMIDDVRVYDRALAAAEVSALYTGTACP